MASWDLFREMESMTRDMDNLLRSFGAGRGLEPSFAAAFGGRGYPRINLREDENNFYLEALLPGIDAKALEMSVLKNTLTMAGERKNGVEQGDLASPGTRCRPFPADRRSARRHRGGEGQGRLPGRRVKRHPAQGGNGQAEACRDQGKLSAGPPGWPRNANFSEQRSGRHERKGTAHQPGW